jgi:hypothetical protein
LKKQIDRVGELQALRVAAEVVDQRLRDVEQRRDGGGARNMREIAFVFVLIDFALSGNRLIGLIPSTVRALSSWYFLSVLIAFSPRLQWFPGDVLGERIFVVALSILT